MIELTVRVPHLDALDEATKSRLLRVITNGCYANGFGVVSVYFPDGDTNDCDAPVSDRHTPLSLMGMMTTVQTDVLNLKTELVGVAYDEHASPFMREQVLRCLSRAGLFNGDVQAEVDKHPNYAESEWVDPDADD